MASGEKSYSLTRKAIAFSEEDAVLLWQIRWEDRIFVTKNSNE